MESLRDSAARLASVRAAKIFTPAPAISPAGVSFQSVRVLEGTVRVSDWTVRVSDWTVRWLEGALRVSECHVFPKWECSPHFHRILFAQCPLLVP